MPLPRRPTTLLRYLLPALLLLATVTLFTSPHALSSRLSPLLAASPWPGARHKHPIDGLIAAAEKEFEAKLARATDTIEEAAAEYRKRRGRHPPPGWDKWYAFAREKDALVVEEFWDQVYHDLEPFWGVPPAKIRRDAGRFEMRIAVRGGKAETGSDWFWTRIWLEMIKSVEEMLPDLDLALNAMDEPRMVVPWEEMRGLMRRAGESRRVVEVERVVEEFGLPAVGGREDEEGEEKGTRWEHEKHYWLIAREGCPPNSPARRAEVTTNFTAPPIANNDRLAHMRRGFVANYTLSTDFCHQPDLQALEGVFVEPLSVSSTKSLLPIFGGSKLAANNDILLPAPMYWNEEERFTGAEGASIPWAAKHPSAIWRGVATGGLNRESNWHAFQRHRFVAMNNATLLAQAESASPASNPSPLPFPLPAHAQYPHLPQPLHPWLSPLTNISFTDLMCANPGFAPGCNYTNPFYATSPSVPMAEQFHHRYLPDIDGNSFSGRYLGFLRSTSLPIKASLWREWHDARLVAWKHFVPMDCRFGDWYGILGYFLGVGGVEEGRDEVAERIAMKGREWAARVLRKEDMLVYVLRLLLEYARVVDENREVLGWVGDLR
ncbi:glycosyltransferase [Staphylotrichum tortipilum]|uniref:Glycosyltransferase n=1 Tax=Staphylotrichum tortipilum TaxID=2831512 RepID=A0AAN6MJ66_9PEZI|nr:glycosyltransferase [Staphylotrichum longicolle]